MVCSVVVLDPVECFKQGHNGGVIGGLGSGKSGFVYAVVNSWIMGLIPAVKLHGEIGRVETAGGIKS